MKVYYELMVTLMCKKKKKLKIDNPDLKIIRIYNCLFTN